MKILSSIYDYIKSISIDSDFQNEIIVAIIGVLVGAIFTAYINGVAIRKQAQFDMEYSIVKKYYERMHTVYDEIVTIEVNLPYENWDIKKQQNKIYMMDGIFVDLHNRICEERRFAPKYLSAKIVCEIRKSLLLFHEIFFDKSIDLAQDMVKNKLSNDSIADLRKLEEEMEKICILLSESMENLFMPGILGGLKRKRRKFMIEISNIKISLARNKL